MTHHDIRKTAVDAERHWWVQKLLELTEGTKATTAFVRCSHLDALIQERTQWQKDRDV